MGASGIVIDVNELVARVRGNAHRALWDMVCVVIDVEISRKMFGPGGLKVVCRGRRASPATPAATKLSRSGIAGGTLGCWLRAGRRAEALQVLDIKPMFLDALRRLVAMRVWAIGLLATPP